MEIHNHGASSLSAPSPTFTSYSSEDLGDIAARVVSELNLSISDDDFYSSLHQHDADAVIQEDDNDDDDDDDDDGSEFEFAVLRRDDDSSPISADEIFDNGQIRPMFPLFNTDLIYDGVSRDVDASEQRTIRLPLRNLLTKERESAAARASCSSSEGNDLEGIPEGTYCVWAPKKKEDMMIAKKSNSTGSSSKRFRIRDLLYNRSNSDGKDTFLFLTPASHRQGGAGDQKVVAPTKKKGMAVDGKRKSYLPYRQDLVAFFANVNTVSRTVRPF